MSPLREQARGRWTGILPSLGVSREYLSGKHTACPICRDGKDRFRFDDKEGCGTWICSRCGAGDGVQLVMEVTGWEFRKAATEIEKLVGTVQPIAPPRMRSEAEKRDALNDMWRRSRPVQAHDPAGRYLSARVGLTSFPACLRTLDRAKYMADPPSWYPAMVAMVIGPNGAPATLHRTYLTGDGRKAPVAEPKRLMEGNVPKGSAIRLAEHSGILGISEGIENALSATVLFGVPCWAGINGTVLAGWEPPPDVREVIVFADNDANYAGQKAAYALAHRIAKAARPVRVELPPAGLDWNDVLLRERSVAA